MQLRGKKSESKGLFFFKPQIENNIWDQTVPRDTSLFQNRTKRNRKEEFFRSPGEILIWGQRLLVGFSRREEC